MAPRQPMNRARHEGGDPLLAGGQVQVVGVAEDELVAEARDVGRRERANAALRGERDEGRRGDRAPGEPEPPGPGGPVACVDLKGEAGRVGSHDSDPREGPLVNMSRVVIASSWYAHMLRGDLTDADGRSRPASLR